MDSQVRIDPTDRLRCSSVPALKLDCIPYIKRRVPSSPAFNPAGARARAPVPPVNNMMLHGKTSVPSFPTVNAAPAASEPTPQLNQPPIVRHDRTQLTVAELRGDSSAVYAHPKSPSPTNLQQSTAPTSDSHPKKKAKRDPIADAIGEMTKSVKEFLASQAKPLVRLEGKEVLDVVLKVPKLSRLQVMKAVRILLNGNPEEFSLVKSLNDSARRESGYCLLLVNLKHEPNEESKVARDFKISLKLVPSLSLLFSFTLYLVKCWFSSMIRNICM